MRRLKIVLGDLGYTKYAKHTRESMFVPLNIGYVAQHCLQTFRGEVELRLFKDPEKLWAHCLQEKPDVLGLSFYFWNTDINRALLGRLRSRYGKDMAIVWGGASVGTDNRELESLFTRFPGVDAFVINEGELGFANVVSGLLGSPGGPRMWTKPIDGAVFSRHGSLIQGRPVGLTLDLAKLGSPYLNGLLDEFLAGDYIPLLQTSRMCPYTCAFCASGKNQGKLRAFPLEQVKAEIDHICGRYKDLPHMPLVLADDNLGIHARDPEIAEHLRETSLHAGYPQSVFFYNDKRFLRNSRKIIETLGRINAHGLVLSLQSGNPDTLKAVKRRNLAPGEIEEALTWASDRNISTTTELIFGLPHETRRSFLDLMRACVERGFDSVLGLNLILMDGIELNAPDARARYGLKTKFRPVGTHYGEFDGEFCAESEEVVVESKTFSFDDFLFIRSANFMFYSVFALNFRKWFFQFVRHSGVDLVQFMMEFICPGDTRGLPEEHLRFCGDVRKAFTDELFDSRAAVKEHLRQVFELAGRTPGKPVRQNVLYGSRLIYMENAWLVEALLATLRKFVDPAERPEVFKRAEFILELCARERIDLRGDSTPQPLVSEFDFAGWKADKFKRPLEDYAIPPSTLRFVARDDVLKRVASFRSAFGSYDAQGFYFAAMDFMGRRDLLYDLACVPSVPRAI